MKKRLPMTFFVSLIFFREWAEYLYLAKARHFFFFFTFWFLDISQMFSSFLIFLLSSVWSFQVYTCVFPSLLRLVNTRENFAIINKWSTSIHSAEGIIDSETLDIVNITLGKLFISTKGALSSTENLRILLNTAICATLQWKWWPLSTLSKVQRGLASLCVHIVVHWLLVYSSIHMRTRLCVCVFERMYMSIILY